MFTTFDTYILSCKCEVHLFKLLYVETDSCRDEADVNVSNNETPIPTDMDVHMGDDVCDNADAGK